MVSFAYTLTDPMGLHMRPAGVMAKRLAETPCSVVIRCGTRSADAKSILNVMALAAKCGETVTIEVRRRSHPAGAEGIFHCQLLSGATQTKAERPGGLFRPRRGALFCFPLFCPAAVNPFPRAAHAGIQPPPA